MIDLHQAVSSMLWIHELNQVKPFRPIKLGGEIIDRELTCRCNHYINCVSTKFVNLSWMMACQCSEFP